MSEYIYDWTPNKQHRKEPIVRCRDCRYFRVGANTDCCAFTEKYAHPDGFCAWAVRKDGGND